METQPVTLADFLLARIAETERAAERVTRVDLSADWADDGSPDSADFKAFVSKERVLAECEAKRRIVERITDGCGHPWISEDGVTRRYLGGWCDQCDKVLTDLALPYADHPDCRDEWRG